MSSLAQPFEVLCADSKSVKCTKYIPNALMRFGPHKERIDLYVFEGSDAYDMILGRQWFKKRNIYIDNGDDSIVLPGDNTDKRKTVRVPITGSARGLFRKGRYLNLQEAYYVKDSADTEVYTCWKEFDKANNRSLECHLNQTQMFRVKITKNILGHEVEMFDPDPEILAEFDPPDTDMIPDSVVPNDYNARVPKTKNVIHDFEGIQNTRTPLQEKPITNFLEQKVWDRFGEGCTHANGNLFPQEITSIDPKTGALRGQVLEPVIEIMEEHKGKAPCKPVMKLSPDHEKELYAQIKYYLEKGWIVPSTSPFGCAVFFVPKKSGKLRIILDYRGLNSITKKDKFALLDPTQLTTQLAGAKFYSSLDMSHGYHQMVLEESDRPKAAFRTLHGSYQWNVLTFGLTNAVPAFIKAMERVLRKHIGK